MKTGNNSTFHEPLLEEWIGRRSWILHQISFNPSIPDLFICDTATTWIASPVNKPYVYVRLDWVTFSISYQVSWIECILNIPD